MEPPTHSLPSRCARDIIRDCGLPRLEVRCLLEWACQRTRSWLLAHDLDPLPTDALCRFDNAVAERKRGTPIAYLTGAREFYGQVFTVGPGVLIPRQDTEQLIDVVLHQLGHGPAPPARVLDLGTGSGILAITLKRAFPASEVLATDLSDVALQFARLNSTQLMAPVQFYRGSWFDALPVGMDTFNLIVSNPPYIEAADEHLHQGDLRFEPLQALTDEADGLCAYRLFAREAAQWLAPGGWIVIEHGYQQGAQVRELFSSNGFSEIVTTRDLAGLERITRARWVQS